ncbi:MAG: hypothetical protein AVDCRST_MAG30-3592 [uncultured Solirubrobacteraceae bacterium]|uniref:Uncharacterized protein n=1 Tax=uncultured Solirubrobacteraceae bacterium TaxID=1162706 RepID=A0A6J4TR91_9ACTN|nr:MAG: hypothetical protein AVDCRST_MAG30-3592 [uncultured Solirubrobacteraceae bacterium]
MRRGQQADHAERQARDRPVARADADQRQPRSGPAGHEADDEDDHGRLAEAADHPARDEARHPPAGISRAEGRGGPPAAGPRHARAILGRWGLVLEHLATLSRPAIATSAHRILRSLIQRPKATR